MRHSKIVAYRRAEVSKMLVDGLTQDAMAKSLNCSQGLICNDVAYLDTYLKDISPRVTHF
jgi:hypothetical protein